MCVSAPSLFGDPSVLGTQRPTLSALDQFEGGAGERNRPGHFAASRVFAASSAAKWRATALVEAALRLALKASRLARIQSIDCERQGLRSSKRGSTERANNS